MGNPAGERRKKSERRHKKETLRLIAKDEKAEAAAAKPNDKPAESPQK